MFTISNISLEPQAPNPTRSPSDAGGVVIFEGRVRDNHNGRPVVSLEYESYKSLAESEGGVILEEAKDRFSILSACVTHRVGLLKVGELAVLVRVAAAHRADAFNACEYIIDQLKTRLPIWKKEYYLDGEASWVSCQESAQHAKVNFNEANYYHRQLQLSEVGTTGQKKLQQARVLVVGAGGLGCPALTYLTLAGIGHIGICDGDSIDVSNLHRQTLYPYSDIGKLKVAVAKRQLMALNPFVTINAHECHIDASNIKDVLSGYDLILDCTDDMQTKFLIHDACHFQQKPLIQAGIYKFEGQLQVFLPDTKKGCLRCLFPQPPEKECYQSCEEAGIIGHVTGIMGSFQAMEATKILLGGYDAASRDLLLFNLNDYQITRVERSRNSSCPLCGDHPTIPGIVSTNYGRALLEEWDINLANSPEEAWRSYSLIDIRREEERNFGNPLSLDRISGENIERFHALPHEKSYLLVCQKGLHSHQLVKKLRTLGHNHFFSLVGGIDSLKNF